MHDEQPAVVAGIYTQPYNEIVRPERVWKISKYFLRRWTPYLSASEAWLVIGARQLSYFNERRPWFRAYDRTLAEAAGLHVKVFRRTIKKAICEQTGSISAFLRKTADPHYTRSDGVTRQTQTRYTIRLDDPLTPGDAAALAFWLRRNSPPQVTPQSVIALLAEASSLPARDLQSREAGPVAGEAPGLLAASDVVTQVFPSIEGDRSWREAADTLHTHLVTPELAHFETQYFRRHWLPLLGPGPALLLTYLRSLCYHNEESGEIRDQVALQSGQLEDVLQVSSRTLRRWFAKLDEFAAMDALMEPFVQTMAAVKQPDQKVLTTYHVGLRTPLTPEDLALYRQRLLANGGALQMEADEKFPTPAQAGQVGNGQRVPHTTHGQGQKVPHTIEGEGQEVPYTAQGNGQKGTHTDPGPRQKVAHTSMGDGQIVPDGYGGEGQMVAGWATEEGSYKYYKILLRAAGLDSFEDLLRQVPQQEQQIWQEHWLLNDGQARASFAAVVARDSTAYFLDRIGVQEPARGEILAQRVGVVEAVAWMLYALQQDSLERPLNYVISRLCRGDPPPLDYVQLASLSWEQWRTYAWASQAQPLPGDTLEAFERMPLFAQWSAVYGALHVDDLPFEVGAGLAQLAGRVTSNAGKRAPEPQKQYAAVAEDPAPEDVALWQAALEELHLQMTRATFDAWLRGAQLSSCHNGVYVIAVAGPEARSWLENRLQETVARTVRGVTEGRVQGVRFVVPNEAGRGAPG